MEVRNALRGIRSRLAQLATAAANSEKVLADLEARLAALDEHIADKERGARQSLANNDEDSARRLLAEKGKLVSNRAGLAAQSQALRDDLARIADLRAQLEAKAAELEAVSARGELAEFYSK